MYRVTTEPYHYVSNPWWLSNDEIVAVKWYTSERSVGAGELWAYKVIFSAEANQPDFHNPGKKLVGRNTLSSQIGPEEPVASPTRYVLV